jgi:polyferredoxin
MAATRLRPRLRLLRVLHARPHRFARLRWITQGLSFAVLYAVPLLRLARFDLWAGRHLAGGRRVGPVLGLGAVFTGILAFYVVTFALNAVMGRVFCGFGCPIGQASRLGDDAEIGSVRALARLGAFSLGLATSIALWFVNPRVFVEGSARAATSAALGVLALAGAVFLHARFFRWRFCEGFCPIGVYYSAVVTDHGFGIHFDRAKNTCKDCGSCALACPVGLDPRDLARPKNGIFGIGIDGFPEANHCLSCGECVRACENQYKKGGRAFVPLRLCKARVDGRQMSK